LPAAQQPAEKARRLGLRGIGVRHLLLQLGDPRLRLMQAEILNQHGLD